MAFKTGGFVGFLLCASVRVRIVTGNTGQRLLAFLKALALHQAKWLKPIG